MPQWPTGDFALHKLTQPSFLKKEKIAKFSAVRNVDYDAGDDGGSGGLGRVMDK